MSLALPCPPLPSVPSSDPSFRHIDRQCLPQPPTTGDLPPPRHLEFAAASCLRRVSRTFGRWRSGSRHCLERRCRRYRRICEIWPKRRLNPGNRRFPQKIEGREARQGRRRQRRSGKQGRRRSGEECISRQSDRSAK